MLTMGQGISDEMSIDLNERLSRRLLDAEAGLFCASARFANKRRREEQFVVFTNLRVLGFSNLVDEPIFEVRFIELASHWAERHAFFGTYEFERTDGTEGTVYLLLREEADVVLEILNNLGNGTGGASTTAAPSDESESSVHVPDLPEESVAAERKVERGAKQPRGVGPKADQRRSGDEAHGRQVAKERFGNRTVVLYENGYVSITGIFGGTAGVERLVHIEDSSDVSKKSGLGRGLGAAATMGVNLVGSNMRGDVYLTIVTDQQSHVLHEDPPTERGMKAAKKLAATGRSLIAGSATLAPALPTVQAQASPEPPSAGGQPLTLVQRLKQLNNLHDEGLVSDDEFNKLRSEILKEV